MTYLSIRITSSKILPIPPRGNIPFPRYFTTTFGLQRIKVDHLQRISKTAERNRIIYERYQQGCSLSDLARDFGVSVQRIHQLVNDRRK